MERIEIRDLSVIFLCFDEPLRNEFYQDLVRQVGSNAIKVEGVVGWDAAHKAAAEASRTERFVLVDGDSLVYPEFWNLVLRVPSAFEGGVLSFCARNMVNELRYGYGGLKVWTRTFIQNMRTHEASNRPDTQFEFCFLPGYHHFSPVWNDTIINQSAQQAFRAGFREALKLCSPGCVLTRFESLPYASKRKLVQWLTLGMDADNGLHVLLGARLAVSMLESGSLDVNVVNSYARIDELFRASSTLEELNALMPSVPVLNASESRMVKTYVQHHRKNAIVALDPCREDTE